jgi:hypothetical protein
VAAAQSISQDTSNQSAGYCGTGIISVMIVAMIGISIIVTIVPRVRDSRGNKSRNCGSGENQ